MGRTEAPADTRIMGIVHGALRRDLERLREVLSAEPVPVGRQRRALAAHVGWLMRFLHEHHTGEDKGLWPLLRSRAPEAGELLDSLEADHARIASEIDALVAAGRQYGATTGDEPRRRLIDTLDRLMEVLLPHLDREVAEAMPVAAARLTQRDWHRWDTAYNIRGKSPRELGLEGHFLIDGADRESYEVVVYLVPPVARFLLLRGFARTYRRQARARWQPSRPSRVQSRRSGVPV